MIDAKAFGCALQQSVSPRCQRSQKRGHRPVAGPKYLPTARQLWSWLNVMKLSVGVAIVVVKHELLQGDVWGVRPLVGSIAGEDDVDGASKRRANRYGSREET